jgi:hypothetical protein
MAPYLKVIFFPYKTISIRANYMCLRKTKYQLY